MRNSMSNAGAAGTGDLCCVISSGYPSSSSRNKYLVKRTYLSIEASWFVKYDWRVRQWTTLNRCSIRLFQRTSEADDQISNVDLATEGSWWRERRLRRPLGLVGDLNKFAPCIGFAATVILSTVLRGGYGISDTPRVQGIGARFEVTVCQPLRDHPEPFVPINRLSEGLPVPAATSTTALTGRPRTDRLQDRDAMGRRVQRALQPSWPGKWRRRARTLVTALASCL